MATLNNNVPYDAQHPILRPRIVTADGYLSDLILFDLQTRFAEKSILRTFTLPNQIQRDFANFAMVNLSSTTPINYSVAMTGPTYDRTAVSKVIDQSITELLNA